MRSVMTCRAALIAAVAMTAACTVKDTQTPPLSGPSGPSLNIRIVAVPSSISYGINSLQTGEQTAITVTALGPDGRGIANMTVRMSIAVDGVPQDFGTLTQKNIVTASDGTATTNYQAPPSPANGQFLNNCGSASPGTCIRIIATPNGADFAAVNPESVQVRIVPPGVILPPAAAPTAAFSTSPGTPSAGVSVNFDASASQPGAGATQIGLYDWSFGDGSTGSGRTTSHTYRVGGQYNVTLTVTNDRGLSASATQAVTVANGTTPTAVFNYSPSEPIANTPVFFNGGQSTPGTGHQSIVSYQWSFGDGTTGSGQVVSHTYTIPVTYRVQLTVTDDAGATATSTPQDVKVDPGNPDAKLSIIKTGGTVIQADASASTPKGTAQIVSYTFIWGDGTQDISNLPVMTHTYPAPVAPATTSTFQVTLRVTDSVGRTGTTAPQPVTVP
jgi:PKD repeat protein